MTTFGRNDVALVTGAAGDIGRATAVRLARHGVGLVLADHAAAASRLGETEMLCTVAGAEVHAVTFDVTDDDAVDAAIVGLGSAGHLPNLLVNNAGYQGEFANIVDASMSDAAKLFDVNIKGVYSVLRAFAAALRAAPRPGAVVNMASMAGVGGAPNMTAYSASKAAVIGLTKSAAKDLAPAGIRVNAVSPAFIGPRAMWDNQVRAQAAVDSPYYGDTDEAVAGEMIAQVPLRRYGSLDEVAASVSFLLSEDASYLTGINLEVAGGAA